MDNLEKVEKLRERANVSYEEARAALENNNWDMLDAMVQLEREGKTNGPSKSEYSTSYEEQEDYRPVEKTVYKGKDEKKHRERPLGGMIRRFLEVCRDNSFCIRRHDNLIFKLPVILLLVIIFFSWRVSIPLLIVGLFLNFRYSFEGKDDLHKANDIIDTAANAAERMKEEFQKDDEDESER